MALPAAILYLLLFIVCGCALARLCLCRAGVFASAMAVAGLGCAFGTALLAMLPAALALLLGFRLPAALLAGALALLFTAGALWAGRSRTWRVQACPRRELLLFWLCVLPFSALTAWLLYTHILCPIDGALWTGQSGYGDLPMHLAFIKSIAVQGTFPPGYPLLAGQTGFGYPFLCESVSSVFLLFGTSLRAAYLLPEFPAFFAVYSLFWLLARRALGSGGKASLAFWLFFCGSGFGFLYFCGSREDFLSIFHGYYTTPTNYVQKNIRWVNPLADLLLPQRATLFGWALLLGCLYLLWLFAFEGRTRLWPAMGLLAGSLPLVHTHSFLALVMLCAVWFCTALFSARSSRAALWQAAKPWLLLAVLAGALALPQLFGVIFRQTSTGQNFLRLHWNWANEGDGYFWFYCKNIGLVYLLLLPAFLHAKAAVRRFYTGGLLILAVSECVLFQPNPYDNNKLLFVWHMLGCILTAGFLADLLSALRCRPLRIAAGALAVWLGTFGSVLTLGREAISRYQLFSPECVAAAAYIDENASPEALFCTGTQHLNPVASLAGRKILCGSSLYVYYHGMHYAEQENAVRMLYEQPSESLLAEWGVDYVVFSDWERSSYAAQESFYQARYPVWYQNSRYVIYRIS